MVLYNFKTITTVPSSTALVDNVLSKTQRKTPTVVHKGYSIGRIRDFYMRKVKFSQQMFHDKLSIILTEFPTFDDLHPFYADLLNVLYDRDHYKLALGQLSTARSLVDGIARDYVRLLKYADSLYRCKCLKRAALGRMATLMSRHKQNLGYLEQVRQHLARLPSIDPTTRTLLIAGYPNVGKSSFINKITRADVDVQPYAFTTKSLFVGHCDYKYLRWQVIDTPGILDHELESRNTIEMQSITALAHLRACVLFFIDPSGQCGYSLERQYSLFKSIMPLFANKPLIVVANKTDLGWEESLCPEELEIMKKFEEETREGAKAVVMKMSAHEEVGVTDIRNVACEKLLQARVESKVRGRKIQNVMNRLHLATPNTTTGRRAPNIPSSVLVKRAEDKKNQIDTEENDDVIMGGDVNDSMTLIQQELNRRKTERDLQEENGGAGVYSMDYRKKYDLHNEEWKYDIMPEIVDGKNIADFVDPEIMAKLEQLEMEEEAREAVRDVTNDAEVGGYRIITTGEKEVVKKIKDKKILVQMENSREKSAHQNRSLIERNKLPVRRSRLEKHLEDMGMQKEDASEMVDKAAKRTGVKRQRSESVGVSLARSESRGRSLSRGSRTVSVAPGEGFSDARQKEKALEMGRKKLKAGVGRMSKKGEADRSIHTKMPKHLFSGKRGIGKTDRR